MERIPGLRRLIRHDDTPERLNRDLDEEIAFHLDAVTEELVKAGFSRDDARRRAEARFGDLERHRATLHAVDTGGATRARWHERVVDVLSDARHAWRALTREPWFALGAILTLAIGLAANATMFGVIDRLLLRPPPHVSDAPGMSLVYFHKPTRTGESWTQTSTSWPDFAMLRDSSGVVADAAAFWIIGASMGTGPEAQQVSVGLATGNFFRLLGARPALGRWIEATDDDPAATEQATVLSYALWNGRFDRDPGILGQAVRLGKRTYTVVGVAPPDFHGPQSTRVDAWVPMRVVAADYLSTDWETNRGWFWLRVVALVKPGITRELARERASAVHQHANRVAQQGDSLTEVVFGSIVPARGAGIGRGSAGGMMEGGQSGMSPQGRIAAWLAGVAAVVLLIVCANLANLLLSRASRRRREIAVRLAMGVRTGRLVRQLLTETVLLALLGAAVGLVLAHWGAVLMRATLLSQVAWDTSPIDARVITFTVGACLLTALIAGLAPAVLASRQDLASALKSAQRDGGQRRSRLQRALLVLQAAMAVVLLTGAGLFVRSLDKVASLRLGYDVDRVLVASVDVKTIGEPAAAVDLFYKDAAERLRGIPGVASVSIGVTTPFASSWAAGVHLPGRDSLPELRGDGPYINAVTPEFAETMGTRIVRGRGFTPTDVRGAEPVTLVNQYMADVLWPGQDAIGRCVKFGADTAPCTTVVGVTENAYRDNFREQASAQALLVLDQQTGLLQTGLLPWRSLFIRTAGDPVQVTTLVRERLQAIRADLPYASVQPLRAIIEPETRTWRLGATMFGLFGVIALVVAAIGLYAMVAYDVSQRRAELGVRSALGARPLHLLRLIVGEGVRHTIIGLATGVAIAWFAAPLVADLLFNVAPRDTLTYTAVCAVLLVSAIVACALPALRASRVTPAEVMRAE